MKNVYLGVGTNLGDRKSNILSAYEQIEKRIGFIKKKSSLYITPPWGYVSDKEFFNSVILIETDLYPKELLISLKNIENELGRINSTSKKNSSTNKNRYIDRIIDVDILDIEGIQLTSEQLIIPHEKLIDRKFVLFPLKEIAPTWSHPKLKLSINQLIKTCSDDSSITKLDE